MAFESFPFMTEANRQILKLGEATVLQEEREMYRDMTTGIPQRHFGRLRGRWMLFVSRLRRHRAT